VTKGIDAVPSTKEANEETPNPCPCPDSLLPELALASDKSSRLYNRSRFVEEDPDTFIILSDRRLCEQCRWILGLRKCEAFPNKIPAEIWEMEVQHDIPYPNQHGDYVWERKDNM
jgi:hypothetical protein